jgi:hypothetical protein
MNMMSISKVFVVQCEQKLYTNLDKCTFCTDKVVFLDFVISCQGVEVDEENIQAVLKKNLKLWEESLSHVEFAYNRAVHSTIKFGSFENVYGFKPTAPIDLLSSPSRNIRTLMQASEQNLSRNFMIELKQTLRR